MFKKLFFILIGFVINQAYAISPESGWWWNPDASGSGYNIEIQDNVLAVSTYVFDAAGNPIYYISAGLMANDKSYSGSLDLVTGGQCIGCPYKAPTRTPVGIIKVDFADETNGRLVINNGLPIPIQRLAYGINLASPYKLMGEWALVQGSRLLPVYFGDRVSFGTTFKATDGKLMARGNRSGATDRIALSSEDSPGTWHMLVDSSTSYYQFYEFKFSGFNTIEGNVWTYLKSSSPSGSGLPFVAFRSQSASLVSNGVGPGVRSLALINRSNDEVEMNYESQNELLFLSQPAVNLENEGSIRDVAIQLKDILIDIKR